MPRKPYPSDVSDEEWALVAPYLALLPEDAGQRRHDLRGVPNGPGHVVKTDAPWRWMPRDSVRGGHHRLGTRAAHKGRTHGRGAA